MTAGGVEGPTLPRGVWRLARRLCLPFLQVRIAIGETSTEGAPRRIGAEVPICHALASAFAMGLTWAWSPVELLDPIDQMVDFSLQLQGDLPQNLDVLFLLDPNHVWIGSCLYKGCKTLLYKCRRTQRDPTDSRASLKEELQLAHGQPQGIRRPLPPQTGEAPPLEPLVTHFKVRAVPSQSRSLS